MKHCSMILALTGGCLVSACAAAVKNIDLQYLFAKPAEHITFESSSSEKTSENIAGLRNFTAQTLSGDTVTADLFADADVTALYIWASDSAPSVKALPELADYAKTLPENVRLVTWCMDAENADKSLLADYLAACGITGTTLISAEGDLRSLGSMLQSAPATVFVDANGVLNAAPVIGADHLTQDISERLANILN